MIYARKTIAVMFWLVVVVMAVAGCTKSSSECKSGGKGAADSKAASAPLSMIDNPEYKNWSSFKIGSTVKTRLQLEIDTGDEIKRIIRPIVETTTTLKEISGDKIVLSILMVEEIDGKKSPEKKEVHELPAKISAMPVGDNDSYVRPQDMKQIGQEDVEIDGRKYPCRIIRSETSSVCGNIKATTKQWMNDDIPGNIAKGQFVSTQGGQMKGELSVIEFESLK